MSPRRRRIPIRLEQRRDWLQRIEEGGELPPQIAISANVDVRTVRKQIVMAKREREEKEARVLILRNAMELHYSDMRQFLEKLNSEISGKGNAIPGPDDQFIEAALHQHMPHSPIWRYLKRKEDLQEQCNKQTNLMKSSIQEALNADKRLSQLVMWGLERVVPVFTVNLTDDLRSWVGGVTKSHLIDSLRLESTQEGVNVFLGPELLGIIDTGHSKESHKILRDIYSDMESQFKESEVYHELESTWAEINGLNRKLNEELAKLRLKRIVPGHCDYCPL